MGCVPTLERGNDKPCYVCAFTGALGAGLPAIATVASRASPLPQYLSFPRSSVGTQFWTLQRPDLEQGHEPKPIRHPGTG